MDQVRDFSDDRLVNGCLYCAGPEESREHVPSRVFLDRPFPEQLSVVWSCISCNTSFSRDEPYVACLIESVIAGSTEPDEIRRSKIGNILRRTPALRARLEAAKKVVDGCVQFEVEADRIRNVILKLARGHAAFELSQVPRDNPTSVWWYPLGLMSETEREDFDAVHFVDKVGEVGSRGSQRILVVQVSINSNNEDKSVLNFPINDWIDVQEGRYRYLAIDDGDEIRVKILISEYLACEVIWLK